MARALVCNLVANSRKLLHIHQGIEILSSYPILRLERMTTLNDNSAEKKGLVHATQSDGPHPGINKLWQN